MSDGPPSNINIINAPWLSICKPARVHGGLMYQESNGVALRLRFVKDVQLVQLAKLPWWRREKKDPPIPIAKLMRSRGVATK